MSFESLTAGAGPHHATLALTPRPLLPLGTSLLARALDVIDYGILLLQADGRVAFVNQCARRALADAGALRIVESRLQARDVDDRAALDDAVDAALVKGAPRSLVVGRDRGQPMHLSVLPVEGAGSSLGALVELGRPRAGGEPKAEPLARHHGVSRSEREVLDLLQGSPDNAAESARLAGVLLSPRQREVFSRALRGKPNKLIARELGIAEGTVKVHLAMVFRALGVRNRTEAMYRVLSADTAAAVARM